MTTKFLYFDLGNVLLTFSNEQSRRQLAELAGVDEQRVHDLLHGQHEIDGLQWRFEAGEMSDDEFYQQFCNTLEVAPNRQQFEIAASDMFAPIEESFRLIGQLKAAGHRLGIMSNTNAIHWRFLTDGRFPVLCEAFEKYVTSFGAQSMKPDARIYLQAIELAEAEPCEVFFADDKLENVEGALAVGLDAVQYTGHEALLKELAKRGIEF